MGCLLDLLEDFFGAHFVGVMEVEHQLSRLDVDDEHELFADDLEMKLVSMKMKKSFARSLWGVVSL